MECLNSTRNSKNILYFLMIHHASKTGINIYIYIVIDAGYKIPPKENSLLLS